MNAVGFIGKQTLSLDDAWFVQSDYHWNNGDCNYLYYIINKSQHNIFAFLNLFLNKRLLILPKQFAILALFWRLWA